MRFSIDINANDAVLFSNKLEGLRKTALPYAVRNTLSNTAKDVKTKTMIATSGKSFIKRKPQFFKYASTVQFAKGTDINTMNAKVGFRDIPNDKGRAVEDLEKQEHGGTIGGRTFVALKEARAAKSWHRSVKKRDRIAALNKIVDSEDAKGSSPKQRFTKSVIHAGKGGLVRGNQKARNIVFRVNKIVRKRGDTSAGLTPLYSVDKGRKVEPKATHFMRTASMRSAKKMPDIFKHEAQRQINRILAR